MGEKVRSPDPGTQHGSWHPRGVIATDMAEVLRACVIAKNGLPRRPLGWGCSRKCRKRAEATHAAHKCTLGNQEPCWRAEKNKKNKNYNKKKKRKKKKKKKEKKKKKKKKKKK